MAPSREIEKLQRRWQENPLGLTFAPLAEAYRKEGMFADALELLDIGLTQHPSYVPAHIVKGRCFLDTRADPDAERAFLRVTDLDPENVIALKGLAEIAERAGRFDEAIRRLERLLEFDRSNDEAQQQLDQLRLQHHPPAEPEQPAPLEAESATVPATEPAPTLEEAPLSIELPRAEIVDGAREDLEVTAFSPIELTASQVTAFQESGPVESLEVTSVEAVFLEVEPVLSVGAESPAVEAAVAPDHDPAPEPIEPEPALVVTETMAEVFLRQGHRELALAVYGQLASRDPDNVRIRGAITRLEGEMGSTQSAILPAYAAVLTGGQSVRAYFEQLLATRRPGAPSKGDELSLGSVFGDERAGMAASAASAPDPSFDEFYADTSDAPPIAAAEPPADDAPGADDLEGFTDWLRGLRR